jgi:hypothetical protein
MYLIILIVNLLHSLILSLHRPYLTGFNIYTFTKILNARTAASEVMSDTRLADAFSVSRWRPSSHKLKLQ